MEDALPMYLNAGKSFGLTVAVFMDSCPVELKPYVDAHKLELEQQNQMFYRQGIYTRDAILSTICNSGWFRGKGRPAYEYPEKPYPMFEEKSEEMTKEEIRAEVDKFYAQEEIRRANWKMLKLKKKREQGEVA